MCFFAGEEKRDLSSFLEKQKKPKRFHLGDGKWPLFTLILWQKATVGDSLKRKKGKVI